MIVRSWQVSVQLLKLSWVVDCYGVSTKGDAWPGTVFLKIERDIGKGDY